jgi:hypothetical protein
MSSGPPPPEARAFQRPRGSGPGGADDMHEMREAIVLQVATLGGFKLVTSLLILYFFPSWHALIVILGLSVPWIIAGVWYSGFYARVRLRLLRMRALRKRLLYEEWHVDS